MPVSILNGDCREVLKNLPDCHVNCCVTSPPYFGLRDYGVDGQIGLEKTPDEYVGEMVSVFREVRRVLRDDGTLWLNLGDSYAGGGGHSPNAPSSAHSKSGKYGKALKEGGIKPQQWIKQKDLIGIPWRVAFALQTDGWYLRQDIIWHKPNPMPESVRDRCTKAHEYIFLMSKSARYYYDADAISEPAKETSIARLQQNISDQGGSDRVPGKTNGPMKACFGGRNKHAGYGTRLHSGREDEGLYLQNGVNKRSVWSVATTPYSGAHFAVFPEKLIEPCILAGCPEGGTVLDPFGGSGTTGRVAIKHRRNAILIELNDNYIELQRERTSGVPVNLF